MGMGDFLRNFYGNKVYSEAVRSRDGQFLCHLVSNWLELVLPLSCFDQDISKQNFETSGLS